MTQPVQAIVVDTDDISAMLKISKKHAQKLVRENRDALQPFKVGTSTRIDADRWNEFYEALRGN